MAGLSARTTPEDHVSQPVLECTNPFETACLCGGRHTPCWPRPDTGCCDRLNPANPTAEQTAQIERMLHVATEIIWRLSGKQFGACPVTVRPCRQACTDTPTWGYWSGNQWMPVLDNGSWFNTKCGKCGPSGCSCSELCEIDLPGPVAEVLSVTLDGAPLDLRDFRVDNFRKLVRTGRHFTNTGDFVVDVVPDPDGVGQAHLGGMKLSNFNHVVGNFMSVIFPNTTLHVEGAAGDFITFNISPGMTLSYPPSWTVSGLGPGTTNPVAGTIVSSAPPPSNGLVTLTLTAGNLSGDISGNFTGVPTSPPFGPFSAAAGSASDVDYTACWPTCQEMAKPLTDVGTFGVTYRRGQAVPQSALWAAGLLACELLKACDDDAECALPANAQRIARQGVTVELTPVLIKADAFATGIPEVDLWLQSVNPYKSKAPSRVYSVDRPAPRTTTWPCP